MIALTREEHAALRAHKVTGSVADIINHGSQKACDTLIKNLWAGDDGSFATEVGGARGWGHDNEAAGMAKFWDRHPEYEATGDNWFDYQGPELDLIGYVGVSPDDMLTLRGTMVAGLEIKSPTDDAHFARHTAPEGHGPRSNPHYGQCQHGMLVTGMTHWWQVTHCGDRYVEQLIRLDDQWMRDYIVRLKHFITMMNDGVGTRRKPRISDMEF